MNAAMALLTLFSVIGGFLFGYDTGVMSGAAVFCQEDLKLSDLELSYVVSSTVGAAAVASAASGVPMQTYGRKPLIMAASIMYVAGGAMVGLDPSMERLHHKHGNSTDDDFDKGRRTESLSVLLTGRVLLGVGIGISSITVPVYIAEVAPSDMRGQLVGLNNMFIVLGQMIACGINILCQWLLTEGARWRVSMGIAAVPAFIQLVGFIFLPESPRWLAQKGKKEEARAVILKLRGNSATSEQVAEDMASLDELNKSEAENLQDQIVKVWRDPVLTRMFKLGMGVMALQQLSGINTLMYYGAAILIMVGFDSSLSVELSALLAFGQAVGIAISNPLFDKYGRRALMLPSTFVAALCLVLIGTCFVDIDRFKWGAVVGVFAYLVAFGMGLSSGPWIINAEIYPLEVRGVGNAAAVTTNWGFNFVISMSFLSLCNAIGKPLTFFGLAAIAFAGFFWLRKSLPETKGLALEEIHALFEAAPQGFMPVAGSEVDEIEAPGDEDGDESPAAAEGRSVGAGAGVDVGTRGTVGAGGKEKRVLDEGAMKTYQRSNLGSLNDESGDEALLGRREGR